MRHTAVGTKPLSKPMMTHIIDTDASYGVGTKPLSKPMMTLIIDTDASYGGWHQAII